MSDRVDVSSISERPGHVPPERVFDFDVYAPPGGEDDFHQAWKCLHAEGVPDLVWTPRNEGHWIATRGALVFDILDRPEIFSNRAVFVPKSFGMAHDMLPTTLDPPHHEPFRRFLNEGLSPRAVRDLEGLIRGTIISLIDDIKDQGQCDFIQAYAQILPVYIFLGMLDLPREDARKLKHWSDMIVHPDGTMTYEEARQHFDDYIDAQIRLRRGSTRTDMLSAIINGTVNGRQLTDVEIKSMGMQLLMGGLDTVVNFLGYLFWFLAENPDKRAELAGAPERMTAAIDEILRRFPIVTVARLVRQDVEIDGVTLKEGDMVVVPSALVGTDDRLNDDPMTVDFHRSKRIHATFGMGNHNCPGAMLARSEIRITVEEWLRRIPSFALAPGARVAFKGGLVATVVSLPLVWGR